MRVERPSAPEVREDAMTPLDVEALLEEGTRLRALARALAGGSADADDLVQETWLRALQRPPRRGFGWRAWISGLVRNVARERRRAEQRRAIHETERSAASQPPAGEDPLEVAARFELLRRVLAHVDALAEPQRTTLLRRYFDGLEPAEIARRDGVPDATVRSRLKRGLDEVRTHLDAEHGGNRGAWLAIFVPWARPEPAATAAAVAISGGLLWKVLLAAAAAIVVIAGARWIATSAMKRTDSSVPTTHRDVAGESSIAAAPPPAAIASAASRSEASPGDPPSEGAVATTPAPASATWTLDGVLHGLSSSVPWTGSIRVELLAGEIHELNAKGLSVEIDAQGRFSLAIDPNAKGGGSEGKIRALRVSAIDPAYVDVDKLVETLDERGSRRATPFTFHVELTTRPSARIHGRVVDEAGAPVVGAWLSWDEGLHHEGQEEWRDLENASTDREGRFKFESSAPERTLLVVTPPRRIEFNRPMGPDGRGLLSTVADLAVEPGSDRLAPDIVLKRGVKIRGTLHDPEGRPVGRAVVTAMPFVDWNALTPGTPEAIEWSHAGSVDAFTDEDGTFEIDGVRPGPCDVAACGRKNIDSHGVVGNGIRDNSTRVEAPAENVEVIDRLVRVELRLQLDGQPCRKRGLSIKGFSADGTNSSMFGGQTDGSGRLVFVGRRGLKFQPLADGDDVEHELPPFVLADDASERVVTLDLVHRHPRASLSLKLCDPSGAQVTRAWIRVDRDDGVTKEGREFRLDSKDSIFLLEDLEPGPVHVVVRPGGFHFGGGGFYEEERFDFDLEAPQCFEEALTVCPTGRLSVHAVDRDGKAVRARCSLTTLAGAPVPAGFTLAEVDTSSFSPMSTFAAPAFVTPSPPPGRYRITFEADGFARQTVEAEVVVGRTTDVVVTLETR
jgi:RNA polymerase sigma factor (sigma-70 family)